MIKMRTTSYWNDAAVWPELWHAVWYAKGELTTSMLWYWETWFTILHVDWRNIILWPDDMTGFVDLNQQLIDGIVCLVAHRRNHLFLVLSRTTDLIRNVKKPVCNSSYSILDLNLFGQIPMTVPSLKKWHPTSAAPPLLHMRTETPEISSIKSLEAVHRQGANGHFRKQIHQAELKIIK